MPAIPSAKPVIVFDVGKVLIDYDPDILHKALSGRAGFEVGARAPLDLEQLICQVFAGRLTWPQVLAQMARHLDIRLTVDEWRALWCGMVTGEVRGMRAALRDLKPRCRLVALSNTEPVHWDFVVAHYGILGMLDGWVLSFEEGCIKPEPEIYRLAMERLCADRPPLYFTDDNPANIEAAQRLGWDAGVFQGAEVFLEAVRARL